MTREEAIHIVDVAFGIPQAVRRFGEDRTYHEDEVKEAKAMAIEALEQKPCDYYDADNKTCRRSEVPKEPCEVVNERTETHECVSICEDAISRKAVLDGIEELKKSPWASDKLITEALEVVADLCIKQEPSVTPQTMWIPISERLPLLRGSYKISDDVLITNGYENYMGYLVERKGKIFWHFYGSDIEVGINDEDNDVIAWMPLPEPYKAERSDEWQGITENEDK